DEARLVRRIDEVAAQRQADACSRGDAVDRGDHRLRQLADGADERVVFGGEHGAEGTLVRAATQVRATAETTAGSSQHDGSDGLVSAGGLERRQELLPHCRVERVEAVRPVERDRGDAVRACDLDRLVWV